ncbi:MAG: hypothetical protein JWM53_4877 [bacterium]|nr:hypothetical protein [bacterium]
MDVVTLDAQAGDNGLAMMLQGLLAENLAASGDKRRAFESMTSTFGIVAPDAEVTVTLAFASGRCTIYDGLRHEPDLVITADSAKIPEMSLLSIRYGMPWLLDENGKNFVRALLKREIRIDGLIRIPPTPLWAMKTAKAALDLVRLTRILSVNS